MRKKDALAQRCQYAVNRLLDNLKSCQSVQVKIRVKIRDQVLAKIRAKTCCGRR